MNELMNAVQYEIAFYDDRDKIGISESTIRRDLREIRKELGIGIKYSKEPPYTERYVRWCERSEREIIPFLLLDFD